MAAIDLNTLQVVRRYKFSFTCDSSPLLFPTKNGTWLVVGKTTIRLGFRNGA